eukprot:6186266-Pleurochrysis_carterae.AAC.1
MPGKGAPAFTRIHALAEKTISKLCLGEPKLTMPFEQNVLLTYPRVCETYQHISRFSSQDRCLPHCVCSRLSGFRVDFGAALEAMQSGVAAEPIDDDPFTDEQMLALLASPSPFPPKPNSAANGAN